MELPEAAEAADVPGALAAPARVELTAHLLRRKVPEPVLRTVAAQLVPEQGLESQADVITELLDRVSGSRPGEDALGRRPGEIGGLGDTLLRKLDPELQRTAYAVSVTCEARTRRIGRYPALSLRTHTQTDRALADIGVAADPREWPHIPGQSDFFKSMDPVGGLAPLSTPQADPDEGWWATLREVVDFSFGANPSGSSTMTTDLEIVYFATGSAIGCTYDLGPPVDGKIVVDRGYVLIEDLASLGTRRVTTLKEVYFRTRPHAGGVCEFWSMAHGVLASPVQSQAGSQVNSDSGSSS